MTAPGIPASSIRVRIFYPADPVGVVPGGVDTFIRGLLKFAPDDFEFSLVGMSTDVAARPVGRWTTCRVGRRSFQFFPVVRVADAGTRTRWPLSVRFTAGLLKHFGDVRSDFDVFEFHRVEPALLFLGDRRPKNAFFHQDMAVIRDGKADILWRKMPWLYFAIEKRVVTSLASAWCVRESGAAALRDRFPSAAQSIRFVPTWVDTEVFFPVPPEERRALRREIAMRHGIEEASTWVISVGRLDTQKQPELLLDALVRLVEAGRDLVWLVVGDGVLRPALEQRVADSVLRSRARFIGLKGPHDVADLLRAADVYALSSAYEGMPMALLEAQGCGLPVVTTDVGEVRKVVHDGVNGAIASDHSVESFAANLSRVADAGQAMGGDHAIRAIAPYQPAGVLREVYAQYRSLARLSSPRPLRQ